MSPSTANGRSLSKNTWVGGGFLLERAMRDLNAAAEAFWAKVDKNGPLWNGTPCWLWTAAHDRHGYGWFGVAGRGWKAHRLAWRYTHGAVAAGLELCHRCDNPPCVNPAHMFLGTHADNMRDAQAKGRLARGKRTGWHTHPESRPVGSRHGMATLTDEEVREIRRLAAEGRMTQRAIAQRFGRSTGNISMIVNRRIWAHIPATSADMARVRRGVPKGEANPHARLTEDDVRAIRALAPTVPRSALARQFGVTTGAIGGIINGHNWRHLQ